jgi:glucose-1-phosphate thymidylyltransferase
MNRKGIVLAGGLGTRLYPITKQISKQLLPVFDKPMIYYPISILMQCKIRNILIISTPKDIKNFKNLFGSGKKLGLKIKYKIQIKPNGIAEAFLIGKKFINNCPVALILGDNIFFGNKFTEKIKKIKPSDNVILLCKTKHPKRFGVATINKKNILMEIEEKPKKPKSNLAVTGLYFYDKNVCKFSKLLKPSKRKELEITDLNNIYIKNKNMKAIILPKNIFWKDAGTFDSLLECSNQVKKFQDKSRQIVASLEDISYKNKWIKNIGTKN